jgi:hypothetical protein
MTRGALLQDDNFLGSVGGPALCSAGRIGIKVKIHVKGNGEKRPFDAGVAALR